MLILAHFYFKRLLTLSQNALLFTILHIKSLSQKLGEIAYNITSHNINSLKKNHSHARSLGLCYLCILVNKKICTFSSTLRNRARTLNANAPPLALKP